MREVSDKRQLYVTECFNNIKTLKLYGWEQKFKAKIESIYQEENEINEKILRMNKVTELLEQLLKSNTFLVTMFVYYMCGNFITISIVMASSRGINYFNDNINRINRLYKNSYSISESMVRLNKLYNASEVQTGLV